MGQADKHSLQNHRWVFSFQVAPFTVAGIRLTAEHFFKAIQSSKLYNPDGDAFVAAESRNTGAGVIVGQAVDAIIELLEICIRNFVQHSPHLLSWRNSDVGYAGSVCMILGGEAKTEPFDPSGPQGAGIRGLALLDHGRGVH